MFSAFISFLSPELIEPVPSDADCDYGLSVYACGCLLLLLALQTIAVFEESLCNYFQNCNY